MSDDSKDLAAKGVAERLARLMFLLKIKGVLNTDEGEWVITGDQDLLESVASEFSDEERERVIEEQEQLRTDLEDRGVIEEED